MAKESRTSVCICPYGERCRALAQAFSDKCGDSNAVSRGGYLQIPPRNLEHLDLAPTLELNYSTDDLSEASGDSHQESVGFLSVGGLSATVSHSPRPNPRESNLSQSTCHKVLETKANHHTSWDQIRKAYVQYFHLVAKESGKGDSKRPPTLDSLFSQHQSSQDGNDEDSDSDGPINVALHHFHPRIITQMMQRQQVWDSTPVWQCMYERSLRVLLKGEDNMIRQTINQSNRLKIEGESTSSDSNQFSEESFVVLPSYPLERSQYDLDRLKKNGQVSHAAAGVSTPENAQLQSLSYHNKRGTKVEQQQLSDWYHQSLLAFEKMRRRAADDRLRYALSSWQEHYAMVKILVEEMDRMYTLMHSSWSALSNYTTVLESLETPKLSDDTISNQNYAYDAEIILPLVKAFSSVAKDWQEDLRTLKLLCGDFSTFRSRMETDIVRTQEAYVALQHSAVKDEIEIRQAWCELEELCIIDSEIQHRRGSIDDRWLSELAYRRLIVVEKTSITTKLQPLLESVARLEKQCKEKIHEVMLSFMPKYRRLFLRAREPFEPASDTLESGILPRESVEKDVQRESSSVKENDLPAPVSSFLIAPVGSSRGAKAQRGEQNGKELKSEIAQLESLLQNVHVDNVEIVSFRVEFDTWVTSFCVVTQQQFLHFFPLLPGTDFESIRRQAQPAMEAACVAAWKKGSTPLLSVHLSDCSLAVSPDGSFIELFISSPPRKKIGLRVGPPKEYAEWVAKTQSRTKLLM
mmetsp:Transcript_27882/g.65188  ORF Transcript_27882/g.65188 Transcript_27882/m.65188 type:complete len:748 (+) Transcript_27882:76-2319(+)